MSNYLAIKEAILLRELLAFSTFPLGNTNKFSSEAVSAAEVINEEYPDSILYEVAEFIIKKDDEQRPRYYSESKDEYLVISEMAYSHRRRAALKVVRYVIGDTPTVKLLYDTAENSNLTLVGIQPFIKSLLDTHKREFSEFERKLVLNLVDPKL